MKEQPPVAPPHCWPHELRGPARTARSARTGVAIVRVKLLSRWLAITLAATLTACGGGSNLPVAERPRLPLQTALHAHQTPIVDLDGSLHIGADVAALAGRLLTVASHGDTSISHGTIRDGVGAEEVIAYLQADAFSYRSPDNAEDKDVQLLPDGLVFRFAATPPTVRVAEGTPPELLDETVRAVQAINAALPREWQLRFGPEISSAGTSVPADGEILVTFAPQEDWPSEAVSPVNEDIGLAEPRYKIVATEDPEAPWSIEIVAGRVWVDPSQTEGRERLGVIAHELIHLLGRNHVDPERFPETLMLAGGSEEVTVHVLHPLDREALLAVYGRLNSGTSPDRIAEEFGPWSDTSIHVRGVLDIGGGEVAFGAALRNGLTQPWAVGSTPNANLEDNAALSGSRALVGSIAWVHAACGDRRRRRPTHYRSADLVRVAELFRNRALVRQCGPGSGRERRRLARWPFELPGVGGGKQLRSVRWRCRTGDGDILRLDARRHGGAFSFAMT